MIVETDGIVLKQVKDSTRCSHCYFYSNIPCMQYKYASLHGCCKYTHHYVQDMSRKDIFKI